MDTELESWRNDWQAQDSIPAELLDRVKHDIRMRRLGLIASVVVTIVFGGSVSIWAVVSSRTDVAVLTAGVWLFIAITWAMTVLLDRRRGSRTPGTATTTSYLIFSVQSCRARVHAITVSTVLYLCFSAFVLGWRYQLPTAATHQDVWTYLNSPRVASWILITVGLGIIAAIRRRRLKREIENLLALQRHIHDTGSPGA